MLKGIMILGFNEDYEAYIDAQYPKNISKKLKFKPSELLDIYTLHKMERVEPNFIQSTINNQNIASFYTGSNFQQFVGLPDYTVTIFLADEDLIEDILPEEFEGMIRRIAHLVLPHSENNPDYHDMVKNFFSMLQNGDLEPYWEEYNEDYLDNIPGLLPKEINDISEEIISEDVVSEEIGKEEGLTERELLEKMLFETSPIFEEDHDVVSIEVPIPETSLINEEETEDDSIEGFKPEESPIIEEEITDEIPIIEEEVEEEVFEEEKIEDYPIIEESTEDQPLEEVVSEEEVNEDIEAEEEKEIIVKLDESVSEDHYKKLEFEVLESEIQDLKTELKEKSEKIKELAKRVTEFESGRAELEIFKKGKETIMENVNKLTELSIKQGEDIEKQSKKINELIKEIDKKDRTINDLNKEIEKHIDSITTLKIEIRNFKSKGKKEDESRKDELIDMKKDIKVLRRERDHLKKIVKDNDLL